MRSSEPMSTIFKRGQANALRESRRHYLCSAPKQWYLILLIPKIKLRRGVCLQPRRMNPSPSHCQLYKKGDGSLSKHQRTIQKPGVWHSNSYRIDLENC